MKQNTEQPREGVEVTPDGVTITKRNDLTVADAVRLSRVGYEFKTVKKQRRGGLKSYFFKYVKK